MLVTPPKPGQPIGPNNCPSSHGTQGFLAGTVFDQSLGCYVCPCGKRYFSDIERPAEVPMTRSLGLDAIAILNKDDKNKSDPKIESKDVLA